VDITIVVKKWIVKGFGGYMGFHEDERSATPYTTDVECRCFGVRSEKEM
jgi:hypothetical protein